MPPDPVTYQRAAWMRRHLTPPEATLWRALKGKALAGFKFRRQHPVGPYILDFYCAAAKLAIEVDGAAHDGEVRLRHDERRTTHLERLGIRVVRFPATAVRDDPDAVVAAILHDLTGR